MVPGIGTIHGCWASSQARATWAGVAPLRSASRLTGRRAPGWLPASLEAREGCADVALAERGRGVTWPVRKPAERAERHEADAELLEGGSIRLLGLAPEERVLALQRGHRLDGVGAADGRGAGLGHAEVPDLAGLDQFLTAPATSSMGTSGSTRCW